MKCFLKKRERAQKERDEEGTPQMKYFSNTQCDKTGDFSKFLLTNLLPKGAKKMVIFWAVLKNVDFCKTAVDTIRATFGIILATF